MTNHDTAHDDFGGLHRDVPRLMERRRALQWMGAIGLGGIAVACGSSGGSASGDESSTSASSTSAGSSTTDAGSTDGSVPAASAGDEIPQETAGPYPADGSNGPNVLTEEGIVRSDLTTSIGSLSGTADGIPTTFNLTIVDASTGAAIPGAAVYLWHCTAEGQYSMYEIEDQNYLRGVQEADSSGVVTFESIFPGCYAGRWPHCHFEVYDSLDSATAGSAAITTSQLALPQADCEVVYADGRYGDSARNLGQLSLASDNVFSDGWEDQLAVVTGTGSDSMSSSLLVRV